MTPVARLLVPGPRAFFELAVPTLPLLVAALVGASISIGALWLSGFPERAPQPPKRT